MFAVISDIHSNLEALEAVLADIKKRKIKDIVCLGDIVGYGPNPRECVDLIRKRCRVSIMGNHDHAVLYEPANFNTPAERACYWTRGELEREPKAELRGERWRFLGRLPVRYREGDVLLVHASPRRPMNEYLFPEDVFTNPQKVTANFERLDARICFSGHTHQPGIFLDDPYFDPPGELPDRPFYEIEEERTIVNVGSVGQPRDKDPRASYVVAHRNHNESFDSGTESIVAAALSCSVAQLEFVRVEYDLEETARKICKIDELDNLLGERLFDGR
ncbi:MAG: metallophosphoesterase family protein [Phycisphaerae bacterium]|nr:metallophosphoesterase family protein [Phycisphaerae bacterium]